MAQDFCRSWNERVLQERHDMQDWIATLREMKVVAAMRDDGRVDRLRSELQLMNPDFLDCTYFGAIVALGTPKAYRLVQLIKPIERPYTLFGTHCYEFVPYDENKVCFMRLKPNVTGIDEWEYIITEKSPQPNGQ